MSIVNICFEFIYGNLTPHVEVILDLYIHFKSFLPEFSFLCVINRSISMKFHTQLENTILKCVTGQHLSYTEQFFFTAHTFQAGIIDATLCTSNIATIVY